MFLAEKSIILKKTSKTKKKKKVRDLPGGPVVKDPPFNAGDAGSVAGKGTKTTHAMGQ